MMNARGLILFFTAFALGLTVCIGGKPSDIDNSKLLHDLGERRTRVMRKMEGQSMMVLFSADHQIYSRDISYKFNQENNLYYLTGINQHGTRLVLMPQNTHHREILFIPDVDPVEKFWTGSVLSPEEARRISGIDNVWSVSKFMPFINSILHNRPHRTDSHAKSNEYLYFANALERETAKIYLLSDSQKKVTDKFDFEDLLKKRFPSVDIKDAHPIFHGLRVTKSQYEIEQIQKAIDITATAHLEVMRKILPGNWEYEIEALIEYIFKKNGSLGWAFPFIVASGPNTTTLHYDKSSRQIRNGELLLVDIGAEYNQYTSDITRTIPCNGKFSPEQAEIYQLVLDAQTAAMQLVRPGSSISTIHRQAVDTIKDGLLRLGLITNKEGDQYRVFFPHGTIHFLGLDVHDVGSGKYLSAGMIFTVEPGIYVRQDSLERLLKIGMQEDQVAIVRSHLERYMSIGVRIEDDVLVTEEGYKNLSKSVPSQIQAIQMLMSTERIDH